MNKMFPIKDPFLKSICFLILILVFHFIVIALDSGLPLALLYGPALFYLHLSLQEKEPVKWVSTVLISPFILLSISYYVLRISGMSFDEMGKHYYPVYFSLMILSLFSFATLILIQKHKWERSFNPLRLLLVQHLAVVGIAIALSIALVFIDRYYDLDFDIHPQSIIMMLMAFLLVILGRYIYQEVNSHQAQVKSTVSPSEDYQDSPEYSLPEELLKEYAERIHHYLHEEKMYLLPNLSVGLLAKKTNIPKHHFSELFNAYLGKGFYQLIAEYRIENAIALIEKRGDSITIEALAYECGFNSKTSFNRHFKEITGSLPSEFRNRQLV